MYPKGHVHLRKKYLINTKMADEYSYPITVKCSSDVVDAFLHLSNQLSGVRQVWVRMVTTEVRQRNTVDGVFLFHSKLLHQDSFYIWTHHCTAQINGRILRSHATRYSEYCKRFHDKIS